MISINVLRYKCYFRIFVEKFIDIKSIYDFSCSISEVIIQTNILGILNYCILSLYIYLLYSIKKIILLDYTSIPCICNGTGARCNNNIKYII